MFGQTAQHDVRWDRTAWRDSAQVERQHRCAPLYDRRPVGTWPLAIVIIIAIVLTVIGPKCLRELGRSLGTGLLELEASATGNKTKTPGSAGRPNGASRK
jgi:mttA/Hcf106 family